MSSVIHILEIPFRLTVNFVKVSSLDVTLSFKAFWSMLPVSTNPCNPNWPKLFVSSSDTLLSLDHFPSVHGVNVQVLRVVFKSGRPKWLTWRIFAWMLLVGLLVFIYYSSCRQNAPSRSCSPRSMIWSCLLASIALDLSNSDQSCTWLFGPVDINYHIKQGNRRIWRVWPCVEMLTVTVQLYFLEIASSSRAFAVRREL